MKICEIHFFTRSIDDEKSRARERFKKFNAFLNRDTPLD